VFLRGEEGQSMNLTAAIKEATGATAIRRQSEVKRSAVPPCVP